MDESLNSLKSSKVFYSVEIPSVWDTCGFISADGDSIPEELLLLALDIRC